MQMATLAALASSVASQEPDESCSYLFSALAGVQAGRAYYVAMCPLKVIPKMFLFDEVGLPAELTAQRTINRARVPDIARYLTEHPEDYVFSAITASVDGDLWFEPYDASSRLGRLRIAMTARFIINDGQHRRAGIEEALKERPELGDETIAVVLFRDAGLARSQQMFADLNKHAVRPTKSLGILYDLRNPLAHLARRASDDVPWFRGLTETQSTTISNRAIKLFTLSGIYQGLCSLLHKSKASSVAAEEASLAIEFWTEVGRHIPEWDLARQRKVSAAELRQGYIHAHGIALHALGVAGHALVTAEPTRWAYRLQLLKDMDWRRANAALWEGRAMVGGRVSKAHTNVLLTAALLKQRLGLDLTAEEQRAEEHFRKRGSEQ
jgi:DNA sulfur modification protein DndB